MYLNSNPEIFMLISSEYHVHWIMEILAQALTLPLEDIAVSIHALNIYLTWLTIESKRPKCILSIDSFIEKIIRHLSLIFNTKKMDNKPSPQSTKHVESCRLVLRAFVSISILKDSSFSFNIKKTLIRVLLGITDYLLRQKQASYLSDELCEQLLASLLETWLRCEILSKSLWIQFNVLYPLWTHHITTVMQWSEIIFALTDKVNKYLYIPEVEKSKSLSYNTFDGSQIVIEEVQDQFIFYAWQQMIILIGDPQNLSAPIFLKAVLGLDRMIQLYLFSLPVEYRPDSNTILFLFGKWLFSSVNMQKPECIDGRAQAFGVLCRVFCRYQKYHPIKPIYLHQFYTSLNEALTNPKTDLLVIIFIIVNGEDIFVHGLPGARLLQSSFIKAIRRIIPKINDFNPAKIVINMVDLRKSCYKLLSTIFGTIEHFNTDVTALFDYTQQLSPYSSAIRGNLMNQKGYAVILDILVGALVIEKDVGNIKYIINLIISISWNGNVELMKTIIRLLVDCIPTWPIDAASAAVEVLRVMRRQDCSKFALQTIHLLLSNMMLHPVNSGNINLIVSLFECMLEWICITWRQFCIDQELQSGTFQVVCKAIQIGLAYQKNKVAEIKKLPPSPMHDRHNTLRRTESVTDVRRLSKRASSGSLTDLVNPQTGSSSSNTLLTIPELVLLEISEAVLFKILHLLGNQSVNPFFPMTTSSKYLEENSKVKTKYYLLHGRSLASFQEKSNSSELLITVRTAMGKFSWEAVMKYYDPKQKVPGMVQDWSPDPNSIDFQDLDVDEAFALNSKSADYQSSSDQAPIDALENIIIYNNQLILQRFSKEERRINSLSCIDSAIMSQFLRMKSSRINEGAPVTSYRSRTPSITPTNGILDRLFLSESGFGQLSMISKALTSIPDTPDLQTQISALDTIPERFVISCAVYHVRSGKQSTFQILTDKDYSIDFTQFLNALGWPLDLGELVFWADMNYEIKYYLPQLIYKDDDKGGNHESHSVAQISPEIADKLGDSCITVFWIDQDQDNLVANVSQKLRSTALMFLCIQPLKAAAEERGLYRIRVLISNALPLNSDLNLNDTLFSPLLDGVILERRHLAGLVRETIISCNRYCQNILQAREKSWMRRMRSMREITRKYRDNQSISKLYNEILTKLL